uniref:Thymidylate kinase n=1 Tax=Romanomermis culicivorax TaxID=13658 RepID=A0A915JSU6_ROMCU
MRGAFIVFEGIDRCGKSTQASLLAQNLRSRNIKIEEMKFPNREGTIGRTIDDYLKNKLNLDDHVIHLLYSADRWSSASVIQEKLSAGISLIVDRYAYSGVAYSSAKGLDFDWCKRPDVGLPKPDIVFYMDLSPALAADRKDYGEEKYEHLHFQKSVYEKFKELEDPTWKILDASKTIEEINKQIVAVSDRILEYDLTVDMPKLWTDN